MYMSLRKDTLPAELLALRNLEGFKVDSLKFMLRWRGRRGGNCCQPALLPLLNNMGGFLTLKRRGAP